MLTAKFEITKRRLRRYRQSFRSCKVRLRLKSRAFDFILSITSF
ncbi:hypothetical protein [Escherichia coli ISC7]|uniref:Uncharacterized protein n=1 Tax=Escherichia coli ISC7 TaxID=1432555 RepID=W1F1H2_ECOLX|nr:hypothetical protein [Escherichia coli ISC7]